MNDDVIALDVAKAAAEAAKLAKVTIMLDAKMNALLASTASIAAYDAGDKIRRRGRIVFGLLLTFVLVCMMAFEIQLSVKDARQQRVTYNRCLDRNEQFEAIVLYAGDGPDRDALARALAPADCKVFLR